MTHHHSSYLSSGSHSITVKLRPLWKPHEHKEYKTSEILKVVLSNRYVTYIGIITALLNKVTQYLTVYQDAENVLRGKSWLVLLEVMADTAFHKLVVYHKDR